MHAALPQIGRERPYTSCRLLVSWTDSIYPFLGAHPLPFFQARVHRSSPQLLSARLVAALLLLIGVGDERPVLVELVQEVCGREPGGRRGRRHGGRRRERREPGQVLRGRGGGEGGHARAGGAVQATAVDERGDQDGARRPRRQGPPLPHGRRRRAGAPPRQGRQGQARGPRPRQRHLPQGPGLRPRLLHRPHPHLRRRRPRQEAQRHHGRLPGAEDEDGGGVQGDGGKEVLHGDGGEGGGQHDRVAHLVGGERVVPAEGDPGARARAGDGHHLGDPGAARRRQGDRAQPARPAPGVPRHGGARRGPGTPAQRHREPRRSRQLLRPQGHRRARGGARAPEEQPQVGLHRRPRRHRAHRRPRPPGARQPPHLDAQMIQILPS